MLVEGSMDEAVAVRLIESTGHTPGQCYGKRGWRYIKDNIAGFNNAAQAMCCLALVDFMDTRLPCAAEVLTQWLPYRHPNMVFRVVQYELESWLMADRDNLASFLKIAINAVPHLPEECSDPKQDLVNLARRSKSSHIRSALVPELGSTAQVGKLYQSEMVRFIQTIWDVAAARRNAPSLDRCLVRLEEIQDAC